MNEEKIRETCQADPERGFRMLVEKYQRSIYWHIRRMVVSHEDAEDVLQETFIRIFKYLNEFRADSSLSTWIYRIATNECYRFLERRLIIFLFTVHWRKLKEYRQQKHLLLFVRCLRMNL